MIYGILLIVLGITLLFFGAWYVMRFKTARQVISFFWRRHDKYREVLGRHSANEINQYKYSHLFWNGPSLGSVSEVFDVPPKDVDVKKMKEIENQVEKEVPRLREVRGPFLKKLSVSFLLLLYVFICYLVILAGVSRL